jgi:adenylate cyclase
VPSEIERKFVVQQGDLPVRHGDRQADRGEHFRQGYLAVEGDVEVRIRITDRRAMLTVKAGRGVLRTEVETTIAIESAEELWPATEGRRLAKVRHRFVLGHLVAEVDIYEGRLAGLCTVEVEFASETLAAAFHPPHWFGAEVTGQAEWSNAELARRQEPPQSPRNS